MTSIQKGRLLVVGIIVATLAMSAVTIALFVSVKGTDRLPSQVGRFLLTSGLMWGLYRGNSAARWIAIILFCLGGIAGLATVLMKDLAATLVGVMMGAAYLTFAGILIASRDVQAFRQHQQER